MQQIDKQQKLDRFLERQQRHKTNNSKAQTANDSRTTATALSVDIERYVAEVNCE